MDEGYNREIMPWHHNAVLADGKVFDVEGKSDAYMQSVYKRLREIPELDSVEDYKGELLESDKRLFIYKGENSKIYQPDLKMKEVSRTVLGRSGDLYESQRQGLGRIRNQRELCLPETIDTPFHDETKKKNPQLFESWKNNILMKRFGRPEEVASVIEFLVSEKASFITGKVIQINGGQDLL